MVHMLSNYLSINDGHLTLPSLCLTPFLLAATQYLFTFYIMSYPDWLRLLGQSIYKKVQRCVHVIIYFMYFELGVFSSLCNW